VRIPNAGPVRVGLKLPQQGVGVDDLRAVWRCADEAGFDHLWGFDHLVPILGGVPDPILEGWMTLAAMAEATSRVRVGLMVSPITLRHPALLAKMAATVDHFSGGRLEFGLGAGSSEAEHAMLGLEYGPPGPRIERLREALRAIVSLWTRDRTTLDGAYYRLRDACSDPEPLQRPHPPIWVGGKGERRTLRVVAELADAWNVFRATPEEAGRLSGVLDRHCADVGRAPGEIRRSVQIPLDPGDPAATVELAHAYLERGFREPIIAVAPPNSRSDAYVAADRVLPGIRALGGA
jgi:F420-dependent oxidoreductase-like protein